MRSHRAFMEEAARILRGRIGTRTAFWFDIDFIQFKLVNHCYGVEKGTELLMALERFLTAIPEIVLEKRVFSDQFVFLVLTDKPKTDEEVIAAWNRYSNEFIQAQQERYPACKLQLCCGICPALSDDVMADIDNAALARKEARKTRAHNAVMFTGAMIEVLWARQKQEQEIIQALHEKRFVFFLQPKVDLRTGQIIGAEALARRISPHGEVIYPDIFLPIMEENGTVIELDFLIFRKVCEHLSSRLQMGLPVVPTSVNLSRLHIENPDTAARLHAIAQSYNVPPELLEFELTETILLHEYGHVKKLIDHLRNDRYQVSIDDYGSGYNSFAIWQELNYDILKLDKRFLSDDRTLKPRIAMIAPGLIETSKKMNVNVICEGVEHADHCRRLLQWGCWYAQGYYFSKPIPPEQFYKIYQEQDGRYPLPFRADPSKRTNG